MKNILCLRAVAGVALIVSLAGLFACASGRADRRNPGSYVVPGYAITDFSDYSRFAVLDFHEGAPGSGDPDVCSMAGLAFTRGSVEAGAGEIVADRIHLAMERSGYGMLERSAAREAFLKAGEEDRMANGASLAAAASRALDAGAVVMGCVSRFEELVGGKYSADKPAHVSFGVVVFDPARGEVIWAGKFDKMQRSLFEDLFQWRIFLKGSMAWQTAETLSGVGADFLVARMPKPGHQRKKTGP